MQLVFAVRDLRSFRRFQVNSDWWIGARGGKAFLADW